MAMNVTPFQSTDEFTMAGFNGKISDINSGVDTEITSALSGFARIETGSYVGTGTYGGGTDAVKLSFSFIPKVVIVEGTTGSYGTAIFFYGATHADGTIQTSSNSNARYAVSWDGKNISWYASDSGADAHRQLNVNGSTYSYIAIG